MRATGDLTSDCLTMNTNAAPKPPPQASYARLSVMQAADRLGVTPRTIRNYLKRKHHPLPHSKPAGRILIFEDELSAWERGIR